MNKIFKYKFSTITKIMLVIIMLALASYVAVGIVLTIKDPTRIFSRLIQPLIFAIIITYIFIKFIKSNYIISDKAVTINIAISRYVIEKENLTQIWFDKVNNELTLHHFIEADLRIHKVNIHEKDFQPFVDALLEMNEQIVYQEITDNK